MRDLSLQDIIDFQNAAIRKIAEDTTCVGLLLNKRIADVDDNDIDEAWDKKIYPYEFVVGTEASETAFVFVEAEAVKTSHSMKRVDVFVTVVCHKNYMKLNPQTFPGIAGSRRDVLVAHVDYVLANSNDFGIGRLNWQSMKTVSVSNPNYCGRQIHYSTADFN